MSPSCRKEYNRVYAWTVNRLQNDIRASGKKYTNSNEKLQAIKEKYKNGVTDEHISSIVRSII